ncbi:hypothetical protein GCM10022392_07170 [Mucilaginibacter panaciglaebae]|uniref:Streptomycin 6-kinase n=2 Tax=Mucilaginibacter panaciglaebae TaxID=502331 RepID=A0ABP7WGS7_9SPHI
MERALSEPSLIKMSQTGQDEKATTILCQAINNLHNFPKVISFDAVPLQVWFRQLAVAASLAGGTFQACYAISQQLLDETGGQTLLHGDIHHGNVLYFDNHGWLAIDPKGLIGDRYFEYANLFYNPWDILIEQERFERRLETVCAVTGLQRGKLLRWIAAWGGLSAAWALQDNISADRTLAIAAMAIQRC